MDNTKKISFGFNKLNKKPNILINKEPVQEENSKVQLIEYLEEQSIKVIGDERNIPAGPLVIPMKTPNKKLINLVDIVKNDFKDTVVDSQERTLENVETNKDEKSLTLDELAAKELMNDTTSHNSKNDVTKVIEVPATDKVTFEGEKESTLDDYDSIPIEQFGKAMLRGMGWKDGQGIGKNQQLVKMAQPIIRPKGMGLGADSITKKAADTPTPVDRNGKVLTCVKGAYIKVIAGYHKGNYGQIMGFEDESGRFIIKLTLTNIDVSLNEFLVTPVTKEEYNKNSKVLNNAKYEEYLKNKENQKQIKQETQNSDEDNYHKINVKKESSEASDETTSRRQTKHRIKKEKDSDEDTRRIKREQRSRSHEEYTKKYRDNKYKSNREHSKNSDYSNERKNTERNKNTSRKKYSNSDSESEGTRRTSKNDEYSRKKSRKKYETGTRKSKKSNKKDKYKDASDSEHENQTQRRLYENSSKEKKRNSSKKRYSDSESEDRVKKSKKQYVTSEDNSEEHEKKSRKHERSKKYDSESEYDERERKSHKKDKYRDRSRHGRR